MSIVLYESIILDWHNQPGSVRRGRLEGMTFTRSLAPAREQPVRILQNHPRERQPGQRLVERELCELLGASRIVARCQSRKRRRSWQNVSVKAIVTRSYTLFCRYRGSMAQVKLGGASGRAPLLRYTLPSVWIK
jgi:hypothetical protein